MISFMLWAMEHRSEDPSVPVGVYWGTIEAGAQTNRGALHAKPNNAQLRK